MPIDLYPEEKSPCRDCENLHLDKTSETCSSCDRLSYYKTSKIPNMDPISLHHIPKTLPFKKKHKKIPEPIVETKTDEIIVPDGHKLCPSCGTVKKLNSKYWSRNKNRVGGFARRCKKCKSLSRKKTYDKRKNYISLNLQGYPGLFEQIKSVSESQIRTIDQQIIYMLKDWLESHK